MGAEPREPDTAFWVEPDSVDPDRLRLDEKESHHLLHVHRTALGAPFEAVDGEGMLYRCVLESVERGMAVGRIVERRAEAGEIPGEVQLLVGLPGAGAVEAVVTQAVPLGVSLIDFAVAGRSARPPLSAERLRRLSRLARAGLKQSRRCRLPALRSSASVGEALARITGGARFLASADGRAWDAAAGAVQAPVALAVGAPGGFDSGEDEALLSAGFAPITLGPNRLTTETASVALLVLARNSLCSNELRRS